MKNNKMAGMLAALLAAGLISGCGSSAAETPAETPAATEAPLETESEALPEKGMDIQGMINGIVSSANLEVPRIEWADDSLFDLTGTASGTMKIPEAGITEEVPFGYTTSAQIAVDEAGNFHIRGSRRMDLGNSSRVDTFDQIYNAETKKFETLQNGLETEQQEAIPEAAFLQSFNEGNMDMEKIFALFGSLEDFVDGSKAQFEFVEEDGGGSLKLTNLPQSFSSGYGEYVLEDLSVSLKANNFQ